MTTRGIIRPLTRGDPLTFQATVYALAYNQGINSPYTAGQYLPYLGQGVTPLQNLTGWSGYCTLKYETEETDQASIYQATSGTVGGVSFPSPETQGIVQVFIPGSATTLIADGVVKVIYDIKLIDPNGNGWTVESGIVPIVANVTKSTAVPS